MVLAAVVSGLGVAATPSGAASLYFGALVDGRAPDAASFSAGGAFYSFEQQAGKKMSLVHWGQPWKMNGTMQRFQRSWFDNVRNHGSIPVLNWASWHLGYGANQADFQLRDVYSGAYDAFITQWAQDAKAWGHPFMLRFNHEMSGWWYPWGEGKTATGTIVNGNSRGDYVKAWQHVHDIFERVGATNVSWLWSPNVMSTSDRYPSLASLYPGDAYVDWTGLSAYNPDASGWLSVNTVLTGAGTTWLRNTYADVVSLAPAKPMLLAEVASVEAGDGGAKKAAWIRDLLQVQLPTLFPQIKGVMWFDWNEGGKTYAIDSSSAAMSAFADSVASSTYASNSFAALNASPIPAPGAAPSSASGSSVLPPIADSFTTSSAPFSAAGGSATTLRVDGDPKDVAFLKFDLSSLAGKRLTRAKLRLTTTGASYAGASTSQSVRLVHDTQWSEKYLSAINTVPLSSIVLGTIYGGTKPATTYDIALDPSQVQQDVGARFSLAIIANGNDGLLFSSREGSYDPQLIVSY